MPTSPTSGGVLRNDNRPTSWFMFVALAASGTLFGFAWPVAETYSRMMRWTPFWYYTDKDANLAYLALAALIAVTALVRSRAFPIIYGVVAVYLGTFSLDAFPLGEWAGHVPQERLQSFEASTKLADLMFFFSSVLILASIVPLYLYQRSLRCKNQFTGFGK